VRAHGLAFGGQTEDLAPADGRLYALRDVTATVECIPLIVSSILSKKFASGTRRVVFDVKTGAGAFMREPERAHALAQALLEVTRALGYEGVALVTDMEQPLGAACGNALEVAESIAVLRGGGPADVRELCELLCARLLALAVPGTEASAARQRAAATLSSGAALDRFRAMVEAQGGDVRVVDDPAALPVAPHRHVIEAPRGGWVSAINAALVGRAAIALGAGRTVVGEAIDTAVGIVVCAPTGTRVEAGHAILELHHRDGRGLAEAARLAAQAIAVDGAPPPASPLVIHEVS